MNEKNSLLDLTPPVSGQPIPSGWFQRLYQTLLSLVISGDRQYTMIDRSSGGAVITLTPAARQKLEAAAGGAPGGSGAIGFPDYTADPTTIDITQTYNLTADAWLIGRVYCGSYGADVGSFYLNITKNGSTKQIELFHVDNSAQGYQLYFENFINLPLRAGLSISFTRPILAIFANLSLYSSV